MRRIRKIGAGVTLAALATALAATGTAGAAATNGNGTTQAQTSAVSVGLGQNGALLSVIVAADNGVANTDPKVGTSSASSALSPLTSSSSVSALNITVPKVSVSSTGDPQTKTVPSISLATPVSTGSVAPLALSAVVDSAQGATSGLTSTLSNVTAVGGLLSLPSMNSSMGAAAKPADADGLRGLSVPSIQVLNLGAVLQGLGINPANLTLDQVGNALTAINATVANGAANLTGAQLKTQVDGITTVLTTPLPTGISGLLPALPIGDPTLAALLPTIAALFPGGTIPPAVTNVGELTTALTSLRSTLLTDALGAVANAPLLSVTNLTAGLSTKAADTVANSTASIEAGIGQVQIGSLPPIAGISLSSTAAQVSALVNSAQAQVNGVLATVGLGNLVSIKVLDQAKSVASSKGYVNALANLTALHVAIAPLGSVAGGTAQSVTDTMGQLLGAGNVPPLSAAMASLNAVLPTSTVGALTQGATVDVLSVGSSSAFAVPGSGTTTNPAAPTPSNGTLAVTGGSTQLLGLIGLLLLAAVAGLRWLRRPVTTN